MSDTPIGTDTQSIVDLLEKLERCIKFGGHPAEVEFNRSDEKGPLVALGPKIFAVLATHIKSRFSNMNTSQLDPKSVDWDMFGVWVWLIATIRDKHNLPDTPYPKNVPFGDQNITAWYEYCVRNQC